MFNAILKAFRYRCDNTVNNQSSNVKIAMRSNTISNYVAAVGESYV